MAIEIERRFLVKGDDWRALAEPVRMEQGYLSVKKECVIRVRVVGDRAILTMKGFISDVSRREFEYDIPMTDAREILDHLCPFRLQKDRYHIEVDGVIFEVDEYVGDNHGLVLAEVELPSEDAAFPVPEWLGAEVTFDARFTNAYLSQHPFPCWADELRF